MFSSDAELLQQLATTQKEKEQQEQQEQRKSPREKRVGLITAMGHFRPKNATPIQFYNYVREFCIIHNCSIDEAMERAPDAWTTLGKDQRKLYDSEMHAALPIPVPRHLIYRAFQMERAGRWKISSTPATNGASATYAVESYAPPVKPTKQQVRRRAQQPRYDNLAETSPCCLDSPRSQAQRASAGTAASGAPKKVVRTLTPPELRAQRAQLEKSTCSLSLTRIMSAESLKGKRSGRVKLSAADAAAKRLSSGATAHRTSQQQQQQQSRHATSKSRKAVETSAVRTKPIVEPKQKQAPKQQQPQMQQLQLQQPQTQQLLLQQPLLQHRASKAELKHKHTTNRKSKKKA